MSDNEIKCHVCDNTGIEYENGIPEGWGFVEDVDRDAPGGRGFWYACRDCKEDKIKTHKHIDRYTTGG